MNSQKDSFSICGKASGRRRKKAWGFRSVLVLALEAAGNWHPWHLYCYSTFQVVFVSASLAVPSVCPCVSVCLYSMPWSTTPLWWYTTRDTREPDDGAICVLLAHCTKCALFTNFFKALEKGTKFFFTYCESHFSLWNCVQTTVFARVLATNGNISSSSRTSWAVAMATKKIRNASSARLFQTRGMCAPTKAVLR